MISADSHQNGWSNSVGEAEGVGLVNCGGEMILGCIQWQTSPTYVEAIENMEPDFTAVYGGKMRGNVYNLKQEVQTGYKEKIFSHETSEVLEHLPRAVVQSPPALEGFKIKINQVLSHLVWSYGWPWSQREVGLEISNLNYLVNYFLLTENKSRFWLSALIRKMKSGINDGC